MDEITLKELIDVLNLFSDEIKQMHICGIIPCCDISGAGYQITLKNNEDSNPSYILVPKFASIKMYGSFGAMLIRR